MFLETIKSEGLSQQSYILGDSWYSVVIDPRRDCKIYMDIAYQKGTQIKYIFETHRNEDFLAGSYELSQISGAEVLHGEGLDFTYGKAIQEGEIFPIGNVALKVLETPGHSLESISLVMYDTASGNDPIAVFSGDSLFVGDVGRTDLVPRRLEESAGLLYQSIFEKLLPLGDHVIIYPAHSAGSIAGAQIGKRDFSTLGFERRNNPALQVANREEFLQSKIQEEHPYPPYFTKMQEYNLKGAPPLGHLHPKPLHADQFDSFMQSGMCAVDIRSPEAFAGAYIPGSLAMPLEMLPTYAGWFLPFEQDIGLIVDSCQDIDKACRYLARVGYDRVIGYLEEGLHEWEIRGKYYETIPAVYAGEIQKRIKQGKDFTLLDIRSKAEFEKGHLPHAQHIYLGELPQRLDEIDSSRGPITTFCNSGKRAIIASSIIKKHGFHEVEDCLGSIQACSRGVCDIICN